MSRFGMYRKIIANRGKRDTLVDMLLEASRLLMPMPGCEFYVANVVPTEPDAIWVTEVWHSEADHDASLEMESVKAIIAGAKPLIAGRSAPIRVVPVGGKGIPAD